MGKCIKWGFIALVAISLLPVGSQAKSGPLKVGASVPDFALKDQNGKEWKLSACKGTKTVVMLIGSIMCECGQNSLRELQPIQEKYGPRGLQVVHLNQEPWQLDYDPEHLSRFAKENKIGFPLVVDKNLIVSSQFPMDTVPLLCLVDTKGVLRFMLPGRPKDFVKQVTDQVEKYLPPPPKDKGSAK